MDAHLLAHGAHVRGVHQPLEAVGGGHLHLVVNALEDQMGADAGQGALLRLHQVNVLRADHHVHRPVVAEAFVHAGEFRPEDLHQLVPDHGAGDDVALPDEIGHKGILRLIVDLLRRAHLLDVALVHNHDGVRHGQGLLLVVGDVDEGDAQLIFQADQLILHVLAQL